MKIVAITECDCDEIRAALPGYVVSCVPNGVRSIAREQLEAELPERHQSRQLMELATATPAACIAGGVPEIEPTCVARY